MFKDQLLILPKGVNCCLVWFNEYTYIFYSHVMHTCKSLINILHYYRRFSRCFVYYSRSLSYIIVTYCVSTYSYSHLTYQSLSSVYCKLRGHCWHKKSFWWYVCWLLNYFSKNVLSLSANTVQYYTFCWA